MRKYKRFNYDKMYKLQEALESIPPDDGGPISYDEIPADIIEAPWYKQRSYFQSVLGLSYCVRCKLPIPSSQASDGGTDVCLYHYESHQEAMRNLMQYRKAHRPNSSFANQHKYARQKARMMEEMERRVTLKDMVERQEINEVVNPTPITTPDDFMRKLRKES